MEWWNFMEKNYIGLYFPENSDFSFFVIGLSYSSILNYLDQLQNEDCIKKNSGKLLVDQLLATGNGQNRFLSCSYNFGKIDLLSAKNEMVSQKYNDITSDKLRLSKRCLYNTVLSDQQINLILSGRTV